MRDSGAGTFSRSAQLTRAGMELLKRTDAGVREAERHVLAKLSEQERRDFRRLLTTLG